MYPSVHFLCETWVYLNPLLYKRLTSKFTECTVPKKDRKIVKNGLKIDETWEWRSSVPLTSVSPEKCWSCSYFPTGSPCSSSFVSPPDVYPAQLACNPALSLPYLSSEKIGKFGVFYLPGGGQGSTILAPMMPLLRYYFMVSIADSKLWEWL